MITIAYVLSDPHQDSVQETQQFTYRNKIIYFHLLSRAAGVLSKPGLTGDADNKAPAQLTPLTLVNHYAHTHLSHGDLLEGMRLYWHWEL